MFALADGLVLEHTRTHARRTLLLSGPARLSGSRLALFSLPRCQGLSSVHCKPVSRNSDADTAQSGLEKPSQLLYCFWTRLRARASGDAWKKS